MQFKYYILSLFFIFFSKEINADEQPIKLNYRQGTYSIGQKAFYFKDNSKLLNISDIDSLFHNNKFIHSQQRQINLGYGNFALWVKFSLQNTTPQLPEWVLEIKQAHLDNLQFYYKSKDKWKFFNLGDQLPFEQRIVLNKNFLIPFSFSDTTVHEYYIRIENEGTMQCPMSINSHESFLWQTSVNELINGIFYGIMLVMFFYNLMIYFSIRDINYLLYLLPLTAVSLFFTSMEGHGFQYLWSESVWLQNKTLLFAISIWFFGATLFAYSFLEIKKYKKRFAFILLLIMGIGVFLFVASFFMNYRFVIQTGATMTIVTSITLLIFGISSWTSGNKAARFYTIAWLLYLIGAGVLALKDYGILESNLLTVNAYRVGAAIEAVLLSFALSDRYKLLRLEVELTQKELLVMHQQENSRLEKAVRERTKEVVQKNKELHQYQTELEQKVAARTIDLKIAKEKAEIADKLKTAFLANMSHEIRTPLNAVLGFSELILDTELTKNQRDTYREYIVSSGDTVLKLVDEIIDISRIEANDSELVKSEFTIGSLLQELYDTFYHQIKKQKRKLELILQKPDNEKVIYTDMRRLKQILANSLDNAIKFTESGSIHFGYTLERINLNGEEKKHFIFHIKDTGVGIPAKHHERIFEKFSKLESPEKLYSGTGLGLFISQNLVELLGGKIWLKSAEKKGTTFYISIPYIKD